MDTPPVAKGSPGRGGQPPSASSGSSRPAWLALAAAAALMVLRKPWALHTPQLWAEDGSIFLTQDDQMGVRAWIEPYNGYLHLLPRLIAWVASNTADPAWWPAIYNGLTFVLTVAVLGKLASSRLELPAKSALVLTPALVVGSGEPLLNATNVQWPLALILVAHLFVRRPAGARERILDLLVLAVVGLNGPFAILLLPFFAWRCWRDRTLDDVLVLGVVGAAAAVQAGFVFAAAGLALEGSAEPLRPFGFLAVAGSRLVVWPLAGPGAVRTWPVWADAVAGALVLGTLLIRACLASGPEARPRRTVAALVLVFLVAVAYRVRFDTWNVTDMVNGDRYFYLPRVLLAWLVIWECRAMSPVVAWTARAACVLALTMHVPHFMLPSPPDYEWAKHCDPIRRGTPANIYTLPEGWWIEYAGRAAKPDNR